MKQNNSKPDIREKNTAKYHVLELAECAGKVFGSNVKPECVIAAFKVKNIKRATTEEAKEIVNEFLKKEVI